MAAPLYPLTVNPTDVEDKNLLYRLLSRMSTYFSALANRVSLLESKSSAATTIDYRKVRAALEASGTAPLNVNGLIGVLGQAQPAGIAVYSSIPPSAVVQTLSVDQLVLVTGVSSTIYYVAAGNPKILTAIATIPADMMTTDTNQNVTGTKTFTVEQIFGALITLKSTFGAKFQFGWNEEETTLNTGGVTTTTAANLLQDFSLILGTTSTVSQAISGGGVTNVKIGNAGALTRFNTLGTLTLGATVVGLNQWQGSVTTDPTGPVNYAGVPIVYTADATPSQGKIKTTVFYIKFFPA